MKPQTIFAVVSTYLAACAVPGVAQSSPASQQLMSVAVLNAHLNPEQPVPTVRVSLSYVDGSSRITDARDVTNLHGQAFLQVSPTLAQRGDLRLEIAGDPNLVIYQPADGQLSGLPTAVTVRLLPKGSPALLGAAQIEAMLHRSLLQLNALQKQDKALQAQLADQQSQQSQQPDLTSALAAVAQSYGFSAAVLDERVKQWAHNIQNQASSATLQQQALAQLALKQYETAAQLFSKAADADGASMDADEQQYLEGRRTKLLQLVANAQQSANAYQLGVHYREASQILQEAEARVAAEHGRYPEDKAIRDVWMNARASLIQAHSREAAYDTTPTSLPMAKRAEKDNRELAAEYLALGDREHWAQIQSHIGMDLMVEGWRTSREKRAPLLEAAAEAYERSLEVMTKTEAPREWADAHIFLSMVYSSRAQQYSNRPPEREKALALMEQAVLTCQAAFEVYTKTDWPHDWTGSEDTLARAYFVEAQIEQDQGSAKLYAQAAEAYRAVLDESNPGDIYWLNVQIALSDSLREEAKFSNGVKAQELLQQAHQSDVELAKGLETIVKANPKDSYSIGFAAGFYHDQLYNFDRALELSDALVALDPTTDARVDDVESNLTTSKFDHCLQQAAMVTDPTITPETQLVLNAYILACQWGAGDKPHALVTQRELSTSVVALLPGYWNFAGTLHYLGSSPGFAEGRDAWTAFFLAIQNGDVPGMKAALHQLEPLLSNRVDRKIE